MKYNRLNNQNVYAIFYRGQFKLMRVFFSIVMREYREIVGLAKSCKSLPSTLERLLKDAMPVSYRSELFTSYILTIFKQRNVLP